MAKIQIRGSSSRMKHDIYLFTFYVGHWCGSWHDEDTLAASEEDLFYKRTASETSDLHVHPFAQSQHCSHGFNRPCGFLLSKNDGSDYIHQMVRLIFHPSGHITSRKRRINVHTRSCCMNAGIISQRHSCNSCINM